MGVGAGVGIVASVGRTAEQRRNSCGTVAEERRNSCGTTAEQLFVVLRAGMEGGFVG